MRMSSSLGSTFRIHTFGESHGPAVGVVIDGCPPRLQITPEEIQFDLDRRRPGQSTIVTQRDEKDVVEILSGWIDTTVRSSSNDSPPGDIATCREQALRPV